ncbi:GDP-mannose 4,6-dehydratase [Candidatus Sumerlaeota bacterium]|nr:GDP-mannose 4,6-dehydratase [Candidatus Sumerlaeota bacterium]
MARILITGGAGFIGSHLAERLLELGNEVRIIDNLSTGSILNIEHLKSNPRFSYVVDTIMNQSVMAELVDWSDEIYHLAAAVGVKLIVSNPVRTIETNIKGTEIVLNMARKKKKKVLIASSSEVYGKSDKESFSENDDIVLGPSFRARWSYACSKLIDEFLAFAYWREQQVPVIIARLFNVVGPRQTGRYGMVIPRFVTQALSGKPITVYGDGSQRRCFCYVLDLVNGLIDLMAHPKSVGEVFNIGSDQEISILELAQLVKDLTGSNSEIVFVAFDDAYDRNFEDMRRRVPDLTKIRRLIGFKLTKSITESVQSVIDYYRSLGQNVILE